MGRRKDRQDALSTSVITKYRRAILTRGLDGLLVFNDTFSNVHIGYIVSWAMKYIILCRARGNT